MNAPTAQPEASSTNTTLQFPKIGSAFDGGTYAGLIRGVGDQPDQHLVLLADEADSINWNAALEFAAAAGGELPTRREQALLFANLPEHFKRDWYWSCEQHAGYADYAWYQGFGNGYQSTGHKSAAGRARAVRRLPI
ncbi:DUF1566 domain-containing protein [Massilia endophytica]|uniref:DUF1566 domain-containing protein n=1 Tax=Massilia endophytica TaxID=2899220 RepID=UPI001E4ABDA7|nr:DUF1566 domain-containing protein [Massilia endophytica]UGQ45096.1 DUF1566 domain-containing protein [Massilia endophytica]